MLHKDQKTEHGIKWVYIGQTEAETNKFGQMDIQWSGKKIRVFTKDITRREDMGKDNTVGWD